MRKVTWADEAVRRELATLRETAPFVYGLTNYVAANLSVRMSSSPLAPHRQ
jgi:hydroxyethylthiazole kinase